MNDIDNQIPELFETFRLVDAEIFVDNTLMDDTVAIMDDTTAIMGTNDGINQYIGPQIDSVDNSRP